MPHSCNPSPAQQVKHKQVRHSDASSLPSAFPLLPSLAGFMHQTTNLHRLWQEVWEQNKGGVVGGGGK